MNEGDTCFVFLGPVCVSGTIVTICGEAVRVLLVTGHEFFWTVVRAAERKPATAGRGVRCERAKTGTLISCGDGLPEKSEQIEGKSCENKDGHNPRKTGRNLFEQYIGDRIRQERQRQKMTQDDFVAKADISKAYLSEVENGIRSIVCTRRRTSLLFFWGRT